MTTGRPRNGEALSEVKHAAIVAAATEMFLDRGYGAASMDEVARAAGVAKQTVYKHFGSKGELFHAIVDTLAVELLSPISLSEARNTEPRTVLMDLARRFVERVVDPVSVRLLRLLAAEAPRFPELAAPVLQAGPERLVGELAAYLARQAKAGRLDVADPRIAAEQFFGALRGNLQIRALLVADRVADETLSPRRLADYAESTVVAFLRGHAASRPDDPGGPRRRSRDP